MVVVYTFIHSTWETEAGGTQKRKKKKKKILESIKFFSITMFLECSYFKLYLQITIKSKIFKPKITWKNM